MLTALAERPGELYLEFVRRSIFYSIIREFWPGVVPFDAEKQGVS
jgi:hypothetical protein